MLRPLLLSFFILGAHLASAQGVGINNPAPDASALLDLTSSDRGLLVPRMTTVQRDGIPVPAVSLLIFNTSNDRFEYYNGAAWVPFVSNTGWLTTGNVGTDPATNFVGTTDNIPLVLRTNNTEQLRILGNGNMGIGVAAPQHRLDVQGDAFFRSGFMDPGLRISTNEGSLTWVDLIGEQGSTSGGIRLRPRNIVSNRFLYMSPEGRIGIATESPEENLHVVGNIRMVDGNQDLNKVLTSDAFGTGSWQVPRQPDHYVALGTTDATIQTFFNLLPQMQVTFVPNHPLAIVHFSSASPAIQFSCDQRIEFQLMVNGTVVQVIPTTNNTGVGGFGGNRGYDVSFTYPISVTPGLNTTVQIRARTTNCTIANNAFSAGGPNGAFRSLVVIDPNGTGLTTTTGTPPSSGAWDVIGNATTNPNVNFVGTTDNQALAFRTFNTERMRVGNAGNVGIGTTAPQDRLHVVGNIRMVDGNQAAGRLLVSDANGRGTWTDANSIASGTLNDAYNFGGPGAGRTIAANDGAVRVEGVDGFVSTGTLGSGTIPEEGAGVRMMWYPSKAAFRVGRVFGTEWNDVSIGQTSMAWGFASRASGQASTAWGAGANASGQESTSWGFTTSASGDRATAWGRVTNAQGERSTAWGDANLAASVNSTAWGANNGATGTNSTAWGFRGIAPSFGETVLGIGATTYTTSLNGASQFRTANATDRLLVVGNAIDANSNNNVDEAERRNAFLILKNGNTAIGNITPTTKLDVDGQLRIRGGNPAAGRVLTSAADGTASWQALTPAQTNAWSLDGNAITAAHVLGSTNNVSLKFQVNSLTAGEVSNGGLRTFLGYRAGENNTGTSNTFVGYFSGLANTTGANNTFIGVGTGENNIDASEGTFVGRSAGIANTTGIRNTYIGRSAGSANIAGLHNAVLGWGAGNAANGYAACTFIGYDADGNNTTSRQNSMALGNISRITADNQVRVGNAGNTSIGGFVDWTNLSDGTFKTQVQENVPGLALIMALRPVTYRLDRDQINKVLDVETEAPLGLSDVHTGFIAQEVETAARALGYEFNGVDAPKNSDDHYGLRYATFTVPLVKAVQEQQAEIEAQRRQLDEQSETIARLLAEMEAIRAAMNTNNSAR